VASVARVHQLAFPLTDNPADDWRSVPCKEWAQARDRDGYGLRQYGGKNGKLVRVHRLVWEQANGPIPDGQWVLHKCDNPSCYEVAHLFLGTVADNNRDTAAKGRTHGQKQTHCKHGHAFTPENTYLEHRPDGRVARRCRACRAARQRERAHKLRESCGGWP
jgi:hypothetical protein